MTLADIKVSSIPIEAHKPKETKPHSCRLCQNTPPLPLHHFSKKRFHVATHFMFCMLKNPSLSQNCL